MGVSLNAYGCHGSSGIRHGVRSKETNFSSIAHQSSDHGSCYSLVIVCVCVCVCVCERSYIIIITQMDTSHDQIKEEGRGKGEGGRGGGFDTTMWPQNNHTRGNTTRQRASGELAS